MSQATTSSKGLRPGAVKLMLVVFTALGAGLTAFGLVFVAEGWAVRSWPEVPGIVSWTQINTRLSGQPSGRSEAELERRRVFHPQVNYRWTVGGRSFHGATYRLGSGPHLGRFNTREQAQAALASYAPGAPLRVFHDPEDPSQAVLDPSMDWGAWVPLGLGLGLLGIGVFGLTRMPRLRASLAAATPPGTRP
jgi:hypothetical protein